MNAQGDDRSADDFVELILSDHEELRGLLERLNKAVSASDHASVKQVLLRLQVWEERHFAAEERAMRSFDYPDYEAHRHHHNALRHSLADIGRFLLLEEPKALHDSIFDYVEETLAHIEELDRPVESFLRAVTA